MGIRREKVFLISGNLVKKGQNEKNGLTNGGNSVRKKEIL